jgi:peptidylprolyl isomerase
MLRTPVLALVLVLAGALTGCSSDTRTVPLSAGPGTAHPEASDSPSPDPSPAPCTPSPTGTKRLTQKPVYLRIAGHGPESTTTSDIVCGSGRQAAMGSNVVVQYLEVNYANGREVDSSWASGSKLPFTVGLLVPPGLSKGTVGMRVGGRRLIVVPPAEGYGEGGPVPGGTLAYIIDLLAIS